MNRAISTTSAGPIRSRLPATAAATPVADVEAEEGALDTSIFPPLDTLAMLVDAS